MTNLAKGFAALGTLGTASGGVYLSKKLLDGNEDKSTRKHFLDKGRLLISDLSVDEGVVQQWQEEFKSDKDEIKRLLNTAEDGEEKGGILLKNWCDNQMKRGYSSTNGDLDKVEKYCLIRTIASQISRNKKTLLTSKEDDNSKWEATYDKRKTTSLSPRSQIAGLDGEWKDKQNTRDADLLIIKSWCQEKASGLFLAKEKSTLYTPVENWCTEQGAQVSS
ncbi:hypothetical protein MHF_0432 [Mycoplasma haemofelis Ohio2]|uniref:Uncharacterized protein n=1 Tax=Mycoplasma haemofelis (strain Ohio2) TaxID=859194 RepID=F6FHA3_MYCHI|nr:hypothetical protein MHF_0432 [Mycoplasma haemofelis Ohio2]